MTKFSRLLFCWLVISSLIIAWDLSFLFLRPLSLPGGALDFLFLPYAKYIHVDTSYADMQNPFVKACALMSACELFVVLIALWLNHGGRFAMGYLLVFATQLLTCFKTVFIFVFEYYSHFAHTGHNSPATFWLLYILPNSIWIFIPFAVVLCIAARIASFKL